MALTDEQRARMEANRLKAMQRKKQKTADAGNAGKVAKRAGNGAHGAKFPGAVTESAKAPLIVQPSANRSSKPTNLTSLPSPALSSSTGGCAQLPRANTAVSVGAARLPGSKAASSSSCSSASFYGSGRSTVRGLCQLMNSSRFSVNGGFHAGAIAAFKTVRHVRKAAIFAYSQSRTHPTLIRPTLSRS